VIGSLLARKINFDRQKMRLIKHLTKNEIKNIKVICFDCDGVTVPEGTYIRENKGELIVRTATLNNRVAKKLTKLKKYFFLVFSSGRSLLYVTRMYEMILWDQVALQAEIGLFTLYQGKVLQLGKFTNHFLEKSTKIKQAIRQLSENNPNILGFEPKQFLITVHCQREDSTIIDLVKKYDPENEYYCLWSGEAYDIGPKVFNKGVGLKFLIEKMGLTMNNVLAVGNDPNDREMVEWAGIGVTTDPSSVIKGADFITEKKFELGGEEVIDKLLELVS